MNWGDCNFDGLLKLQEQIDTLAYNLYQSGFQQFCEQCANELADELLRRVKKRTPVGIKPTWAFERAENDDIISTGEGVSKREKLEAVWAGYQGGHMRRSWEVQPVKKEGNTYIIKVINFARYASYVEFGHRQTPGRYVPALGVTLKKPWVPGQRILTIEEEKMRQQIQQFLDKKLEQFLKGALGNG